MHSCSGDAILISYRAPKVVARNPKAEFDWENIVTLRARAIPDGAIALDCIIPPHAPATEDEGRSYIRLTGYCIPDRVSRYIRKRSILS